jgi:hypothetical protein
MYPLYYSWYPCIALYCLSCLHTAGLSTGAKIGIGVGVGVGGLVVIVLVVVLVLKLSSSSKAAAVKPVAV